MKRLNTHGQLFIPGLAAFLGLMVLLAAMIDMGRHVLTQMRMDMAAQAAALSAARAEAQMLNDCASHNLGIQLYIPITIGPLGITEWAVKDELDLWLLTEGVGRLWPMKKFGMEAYPLTVGNTVARMNGAPKPFCWPVIPDPLLTMHDLSVEFVLDDIPGPVIDYENVYFVRTWKPDERQAQPVHKTSWIACRNHICSTATARVYLDEKKDAFGNNGGFPRPDQAFWEDFEIKSFYPQFNARLVPTEAASKLLSLAAGESGVL